MELNLCQKSNLKSSLNLIPFPLTWNLTLNLNLVLNYCTMFWLSVWILFDFHFWFWFQAYINPNQVCIPCCNLSLNRALLDYMKKKQKTTASEASKLKVKVRKSDREKLHLYVPSVGHMQAWLRLRRQQDSIAYIVYIVVVTLVPGAGHM